MARMKEIDAEPSLLPATLAFGREKSSPYNSTSNLAEGFVIAKKGSSTRRFLKHHRQRSKVGLFEKDSFHRISILIGTKDAIHKWLRMSGPARCVLWIEQTSFDGNRGKYGSFATLELVYRKRDYQVTHVKILQECKVFLSTTQQSKSKRSRTSKFNEDNRDFDWSGLRQRELEQMGNGDASNDIGWWKRATTMRWYVLMKVSAFKQLNNMLSAGGALWEFRRLLLQIANLPEFLDIDFCNIDLQEHLIHYPYAVFLIGCDATMTRITSKGLFVWKIIRFDFDQGIVTLAGGETLKEFICCIDNNVFQKSKERIYHHQQDTNHKKIHQIIDKSFEHISPKCCTLDWAVWRGVYRAGPMETMLTSTFVDEDDCMILKTLTTFFLKWKDKDLCQCCVASDLGTAFRECRGSVISNSTWKFSSKERCTISHLRSVNQEVRRQGLRTLLDILFDVVKDQNNSDSQKTTSNSIRTSTRSTPLSSRSSLGLENTLPYSQLDSKKEAYIEGKENVNLLLGLIKVMDRPSKKKEIEIDKRFVGSQSERTLQVAQLKWRQFEEMKSNRSSSINEKICVKSGNTLRWQQILEWIDNGFLEVLLKEGMGPILEDDQPSFILIEDLADACLQVIEITPSEGTRRIVDFLISKLKNLIELFATIKIDTLQRINMTNEKPFHQKMEEFRISFEEMACFCKLLALMVSSSVLITSSFANLNGLFLILSLYSNIMKEFPIGMNNMDLIKHKIDSKVMPGEVFGLEKNPPKVPKSLGSSKLRTLWLQRQEQEKSKKRLCLRELSISFQISNALSTLDSKISNVVLEDNIQSNPPKLYFQSRISKINAPMFANIKEDVAIGTNNPQKNSSTIVDIVGAAKFHLLHSLVTMLESQSIILNKRKKELKEKFLVESTSSELLSWFILDLIGGPSNAFPSHVGDKLNKIIFKVIFLLDKDQEDNDINIKCLQSAGIQFNTQYPEERPWWIGLGPPLNQHSQIRFLDLMLVELKGRMNYILHCLMITLPGHISQHGQMLANCKQMKGKNVKEYISSLWIDLACLLMVLSNYIIYWPTKESKSHDVLKCYNGHFNQILSLLASLGPTASWAPGQILAMQSLLKLLGLCIQDCTSTNTKDNWSEYENFLWKMLVDTWAHWNCIQSYVSWLVLEVCQGCLINIFEKFQRSLYEPIQLYYSIFGKQLGMRENSNKIFVNFQHYELLPKKSMMFLNLVVILVQRKLQINNDICDGIAYFCFRNNALWFLQEIMNPIHGLLIMAIKNGSFGTCVDCQIKNTNLGLASEFYPSIEQYSLILLAQIFSLKLSQSKIHIQEKCSGCCKNVFLSKKYLIPFLHTLYSSFKNLYTRVIQQARLNSLCTLQEAHTIDDEKKCSIIDHNLEIDGKNDKAMCCAMDEMFNLCYSYAHVLLAAAKNLSDDGNQIYKDLYIMDFLVQEISLEYEYSQIVDSRSNSKDDITTKSTYTNPQRPSSRKDQEMFKGLEGSNSCSSSTRVGCTLPNPIQEHEIRNSTLKEQDVILQWDVNKNIANVQKSILSIERCKVNAKENNKQPNDSTSFSKNLFSMPKDVNFCNKDNIVNNPLVHLSCNPIHQTVNLGSKVDSGDLKMSWRNEYNKNEVVYSGRFFDLNEEVEQELAKEEEDRVNDDEKQQLLAKIKFTNNQTYLQSKNIENAFPSSTSSRSTSCESTQDIPTTLNVRPLVPKLNFTSVLQKIQSNLANSSDTETIHNDMEENIFSNEDIDVDCKSSNLSMSYDKERLKKSIYHSSNLHVLLLELLISLMLNPEGTLEVYYCDRFPMEHRKINAPFYLFYHINHPSNEYIMPILAKNLKGSHPSAYMILKLTWQALFDPFVYINRIRIAQGALSQVYEATKKRKNDSTSINELVILKVIDLPKGPHEPCRFFDVYSEVQILHRFQGDLRVCQILDYGVDRDAFVLVLKHYKCSLRAWRQRHTIRCCPNHPLASEKKSALVLAMLPLYTRLPMYLEVYAAVLQAVKALEVQNVVHYDLKCDNVLLEPLVCTLSEEDFWQPKWPPLDSMCAIPFRVSITDFGQSKASFVEGGECTARNRGTECVKSPEMLKLLSSRGNVAQQAGISSLEDEISVGKAGDVWGLGCLLYELLTGEYLLYDEDWVRFFVRVTVATEELIPDEKAAKLDNYGPIIDFLRFILVRDPNARPSLDDLVVRLEQLQAQLKSDSQLHESGGHDVVGEVSDMDDEELQNELPTPPYSRRSRHKNNAASYKRCQTPSPKKTQSKHRIHDKGQAKIARVGGKRPPRFLQLWRLCCPCCRRDVGVMR